VRLGTRRVSHGRLLSGSLKAVLTTLASGEAAVRARGGCVQDTGIRVGCCLRTWRLCSGRWLQESRLTVREPGGCVQDAGFRGGCCPRAWRLCSKRLLQGRLLSESLRLCSGGWNQRRLLSESLEAVLRRLESEELLSRA